MSLVAYAASSDDESDHEEEIPTNKTAEIPPKDQISDDEDYFFSTATNSTDSKDEIGSLKRLVLPPPADNQEDAPKALFATLPTPKSAPRVSEIVEEDDEFLHKKAAPEIVEKPPPMPTRARVKISIPSMSEFKDVDDSQAGPKKPIIAPSAKGFSLLSLLPKPRSEGNVLNAPSKPSLVPDSVQHKKKPSAAPIPIAIPIKKPAALVSVSDSEGSDDEGDFFSLNTEVDLPEVSMSEINAMVAKKAAQIADAATVKAEEANEEAAEKMEVEIPANSYGMDNQAMEALEGSRKAKRRKVEDIQVIELTGDQVMPNREEWLRGSLASSTTYQPRGVLVDEEVAPGTRKKHQITYLAHQAKANEAELQAMWAANRQTRRQTQSKYGF